MTLARDRDSRPRLLTRAEVAHELGVAEKTLAQWRYQRIGPPSFRVGKAVRYRRDQIDRWLTEQEAAEADRQRTTR